MIQNITKPDAGVLYQERTVLWDMNSLRPNLRFTFVVSRLDIKYRKVRSER